MFTSDGPHRRSPIGGSAPGRRWPDRSSHVCPEPLFRTRSSVEETRSCSMPTASSPKAHPVKLRPLVVLARACSLELATLSGAPAR